MTKHPKIKAKDLNETYINLWFHIGSEYREQLAKEFGIAPIYSDDAEYAAYEEFFNEEVSKLADKEFAKQYGKHNLTRLQNKSKQVILPILMRFYARRVSLPVWRMRSRLRRLLVNLPIKPRLQSDGNDLPDLPF